MIGNDFGGFDSKRGQMKLWRAVGGVEFDGGAIRPVWFVAPTWFLAREMWSILTHKAAVGLEPEEVNTYGAQGKTTVAVGVIIVTADPSGGVRTFETAGGADRAGVLRGEGLRVRVEVAREERREDEAVPDRMQADRQSFVPPAARRAEKERTRGTKGGKGPAHASRVRK